MKCVRLKYCFEVVQYNSLTHFIHACIIISTFAVLSAMRTDSCNNRATLAFSIAKNDQARQRMQHYMEIEWPLPYRVHHNRPLLTSDGRIRVTGGERLLYGPLCARAVLWYERRSSMADNPPLDPNTYVSMCALSLMLSAASQPISEHGGFMWPHLSLYNFSIFQLCLLALMRYSSFSIMHCSFGVGCQGITISSSSSI